MTVRVAIVDDQRVVREGLALILRLLPEVELVGTAGDGRSAMELVGEHRPDVVLMDLRMPDMDGAEATRRIREQHSSTQVLVLTTYADDRSILAALKAGARGYLTKDAGPEEIADAIAKVVDGEAALDPVVQTRLVDLVDRRIEDTSHTGALPGGLTARESEVLRLVAGGMSNGEIADHLHLSPATVKTHLAHLLSKTGARDRSQVVAYAYRHGLAEL